ncbi:hypothetical protein JG688_00016388 [Phytophthora aleatoria]|uniref:Uncharacterized protein n=1 Tax=Phytophthora aleatoria TaxID=2496075 RepID=A0A8J5IS24_9STRA|nr:hypothetical protein JG688_00016388 [Phytophthora aleatoria]
MENTRACVAVKVGEFGHTSRTSVPVEDAEFEFDGGRDNFERVYSLADGKVSSALAKYTTKTTRPDMKLYLKPSQHAKQAQFMALTSKTPGQLPQAEDVRQGIRRATSTRIAEAAEAIDSYLAERQDVRVGNIARTHWGISHAHQPDDASVTLPESATFRKMQHLDAMSASRHEGDREEGVYRTLTVILNSSRDMQLTFNIEELRAVIQLPKYSLIAEGLFSNFQPPLEPAVNMEDINHVSD